MARRLYTCGGSGPATNALAAPDDVELPADPEDTARGFDEEQAQEMLQWPHSGSHVHAGVGVPEDDRAFALRLAGYCARNPVALERMTYDPAIEQVTYRSDTADGPTAGTATVDPLEFLVPLVTHIPDPGQVMQRYYGWYASGTRGTRRRLAPAPSGAEAAVGIVEPVDWSRRAARCRWAELLRRIHEVDPLTCPRCRGPMRILTVITDPAVITRILAHRARARGPFGAQRKFLFYGLAFCGVLQ